jgi:hypothetical protein
MFAKLIRAASRCHWQCQRHKRDPGIHFLMKLSISMDLYVVSGSLLHRLERQLVARFRHNQELFSILYQMKWQFPSH